MVEADAIVNTANPEPVIGGGTDYAIHKAAGPELLKARKKIGEICVGQSVATPAFRLPAKYVLHTVSPVWTDGNHQEEEFLREAYDTTLQLADELGCKSIAFPLMAAGTYSFPHDLALSVAIRAFTDYLLDHEMQIYLVLFNAEAFGIAGSIFDDLKSYIDDNYVDERNEEEYLIDEIRCNNVSNKIREQVSFQRRRKSRRNRTERESYFGLGPQESAIEAPIVGPTSLDGILGQQDKTFSESLLDLLKERNGKDSEVYKRAEISKQLFSKIITNKHYQPTKSTAIQLAIGLQLNLVQTQKLLESAGFVLTRSSKADLVVKYCIEHKIYNVTFINEALYDSGLPLLKTGLKS
ncbi:MAG: macro domain-containing protein [Anaerolineaceae bacterium]|nr:macro domain-containing protein [Anaerolineaceae bacterium]